MGNQTCCEFKHVPVDTYIPPVGALASPVGVAALTVVALALPVGEVAPVRALALPQAEHACGVPPVERSKLEASSTLFPQIGHTLVRGVCV